MNDDCLILALTGPECSGKTTLSLFLSEIADAVYVPEYARNYLNGLDRNYLLEDLDCICEGQSKSVEKVRNENPGRTIVLDTESLVLKIWSQVRFGTISEQIESSWRKQDVSHYFLCNPDEVEWEFDPLRENPYDRSRLFGIYLDFLKSSGRSYTILEGTLDRRKAILNQWLKELI